MSEVIARGPILRARPLATCLTIAVLTALPCWTEAVRAPTTPRVTTLGPTPPQMYMWIGSSFFYYNNGISPQVMQLARGEVGGGPAHRATLIAISGSGLNWHDVELYFRPNAVGSYVFDNSNKITFNTAKKKYEAAIIMDCSQCPIHPQLAPIFFKTSRKMRKSCGRMGRRRCCLCRGLTWTTRR